MASSHASVSHASVSVGRIPAIRANVANSHDGASGAPAAYVAAAYAGAARDGMWPVTVDAAVVPAVEERQHDAQHGVLPPMTGMTRTRASVMCR